MMSKTSSEQISKLWHLRFGHLPFSQIELLIFLMPSLNINLLKDFCVCIICPCARQHRLSFTTSSKTTQCFEMIHIDGCSMFLTIVDDYTRSTWIYMMKTKNQCVIFLKNLFSYVKKQHKTKIKIIRSDNAKELCEGDTLRFVLVKK